MPLDAAADSPAAIIEFLEKKSSKPSFLVVYASPRPTDGLMWCGDCRRAEPLINEKFALRPEVVKVVYAGSESEYVARPTANNFSAIILSELRWRTPTNSYRQPPFLIEKLPTIVKVADAKVS